MANAVQKITLSSSRDIPFNKLVLSQANIRRVKAGVSIEELAEDIGRRPAVIMPFDGMLELRLDIASRLYRWLRGQQTSLLPRGLQLTPLQKTRLILMLHAHDVLEAGGGPRDVAMAATGSHQADLPAVEWKDTAARRFANRLIHDSRALVNGGYLRLLRGR